MTTPRPEQVGQADDAGCLARDTGRLTALVFIAATIPAYFALYKRLVAA